MSNSNPQNIFRKGKVDRKVVVNCSQFLEMAARTYLNQVENQI